MQWFAWNLLWGCWDRPTVTQTISAGMKILVSCHRTCRIVYIFIVISTIPIPCAIRPWEASTLLANLSTCRVEIRSAHTQLLEILFSPILPPSFELPVVPDVNYDCTQYCCKSQA